MNKVENEKIQSLHADGLNKWDGKQVISLYPKNSYGLQSFAANAEKEYNSTEFWCAMEFLDDLEVPRVDSENGQNYSIVGRIAWMSRNEVKEIPRQDDK